MLSPELVAEIRAAAERHRRKQEMSITTPAADYWRRIAERHRTRCFYCLFDGNCSTYAGYIHLALKALEPFRPPVKINLS